jgi:ATP-binding cassette subfamily C protein
MKIISFLSSLQSDQSFIASQDCRQKTVFVLQKLLKSPDNFEFITATTIEQALEQASMRYREVKLDKDYYKFDFGIILVIQPDLCRYNILTRTFGSISSILISDAGIELGEIDNSILEEADNLTAFEIYPSLPYSITKISSFLRFTFSQYTSDLSWLVFYTLLSQVLRALFPALTVYVTTTIVNLGSIELALQFGFLAFSLSLIASAALYLQSRVIQKLESESDKRAQTAVWDRLMKIDLSFITPYKPADLVSRAASISQVRTLLSSQNITSLISLLFSFVYLLEMYSYLPYSTLAIIPLFILFVAIVFVKSRTGQILLTGSLETNAEIIDFSNSIFSGFAEFISSPFFGSLQHYWDGLIHKSGRLAYMYRQKDNSLDVLSNSFQSLNFMVAFISILFFGSNSLDDPDFLGRTIGFTSALTIFCTTLSSGTVSIVNSLINALSYWKRAEPIAFSPIEAGYSQACFPVQIEGNIFLENITFGYSSGSPLVLSGFTHNIISGCLNPLPIKPGMGTSTLFRLLLALYPPISGSIYYDSHRVENILVTSLRSQIKLAPQDLNIPIGNIFKIFRGPLSTTDEELSEFVNAFGLGSFINSMRMGIDTPLANNGKFLPGKQRQLLSLAYATSQLPKVLLVDNCLTLLNLDEKLSVFNFLLNKGITVVLSDADSELIAQHF